MKRLQVIFLVLICNFILILNPLYAAQSSTKSTSMTGTSLSSDESNALSDIEVIDKTEILLGILATHNTKNSAVMDFAKSMLDQHGSNLVQVLGMANNFHIHSFKGKESEKLSMEENEAMMTLGALKDDQFDKAYADMMVKGHQAALDLLDQQLIKTVKTESVKNFLTDTRTAVVEHLDKAKQLKQSLGS